jgi:hypothetical protein
LVAGASGTGKSFFTGNILWRMIRDGRALSVLFLDHKRSFKRLVTKCNSPWIEPINCFDLKRDIAKAFQSIDFQGGFAGIELSELPAKERANGLKLIFAELTRFLSQRKSEHAVYIVIDEAWKQLKDDPEAIEQAFREFRKLEAGVIAITQSLADFSAHSIGQSVIQNAETLILLRQQEDVTKFQGFLNLNETETRLVRSITKSKGVFSEVLIKTPHQSRFGRLYPTEEEHETLRTDNLRAKLLNFNLDHKSKKLMPSMGDAE